jgi:arsenite methyltransferase
VSGALAERVFAHKMQKIGFTDLTVHERRPFGLDDAERYPLFTPDLIELMRTLLPEAQQRQVAVAIAEQVRERFAATFVATSPAGGPDVQPC